MRCAVRCGAVVDDVIGCAAGGRVGEAETEQERGNKKMD